MPKSKQNDEIKKLQEQIEELTLDLQRNRADFDNYRKRMDADAGRAVELGEAKAVVKLLPVVDTIERAVQHIPEDISDHPWVRGVSGLIKQLDKSLASMDLKRIDANTGTLFDPELHEAVQFDEESTGNTEVVADELQAGYKLKDAVIRHAMVKVTRQ